MEAPEIACAFAGFMFGFLFSAIVFFGLCDLDRDDNILLQLHGESIEYTLTPEELEKVHELKKELILSRKSSPSAQGGE